VNTTQINQLLNKTFNIPVEIRHNSFPNNNPYAAIANLENTGFSFTGKELLHAIGSKIASLPSSNRDESIRSAYLYINLLDFNGPYLGYNQNVSIDTDLQTNRSNEIGIGIGCLIANKIFNVNWDTLEPIKGNGKRFDYRATNPGQNYVYEFKGTKHRSKQNEQITNGISKKVDMHNRNENYDVELIISAHLNYSNFEPRIVLADPPFDGFENAFSERSELLYQLRHYSRIAQFIGNIALSRALYQQSQLLLRDNNENINIDQLDELGYRIYDRELTLLKDKKLLEEMTTVNINNNDFIGRWITDWIPSKDFKKRKIYEIPKIYEQGERLEIFQGITDDHYKVLSSTETNRIRTLKEISRSSVNLENHSEFDIFGDGTVMSYRIIKY
jgi:hypothetical protein